MSAKKRLNPAGKEILLMAAAAFGFIAALAAVSFGAHPPAGGMPGAYIFALILGFFLLSFLIAVLASLTGIGGGVLFTPVMLAFTPVDSLIIRATGLILAMFTGLASTGPLMKKGMANLRMCIILAAAYGTGAFAGAQGAIYAWKHLGAGGESLLRISLGIIVSAVAAHFIFGGRRIEWPDVRIVDSFTARLNLPQPYYEQSLGRMADYRLRRAGHGIAAIALAGAVSGFFGLGAGWAVVPLQNLITGAPLKVAAANSLALLGMGDCIAIWPYLLGGAVIPLFAAPWAAGVVFGGRVGSSLLIRVRAGSVRYFLIGILFFTGFSLVAKGLDMLGIIAAKGWMSALVFLVIIILVFTAVVLEKKN